MRLITLLAAREVGAGSGILAALSAAMTLVLGGCGDDGIISRFMLKPDRIIVERRPDPI
jgi:hypothetical protein